MSALTYIIDGVVAVFCVNIVLTAWVSEQITIEHDNGSILDVRIDKTGTYNVTVDGVTWLNSAPTFLRHNNITASAVNNTLKLTNIKTIRQGEDELGTFRETTMNFRVPGSMLRFDAFVKVYQNVPLVLFTQYFSDGANWTKAPSVDGVCSGFPGFQVRELDTKLGCLSFGGENLGDTEKRIMRFNEFSSINDGISGGPLVLFDRTGNTIILSPFETFMTSSLSQDSVTGGNLYSGVMGGVENIPPHHRQTLSIAYGPSINKAFNVWGSILRKYYNRTTHRREQDYTLTHLGYWTSKGMHYFFKTEENKTYEETILAIRDSNVRAGIPVRYYQYGPWWYYRDAFEGVKTWKSRPIIFPDGFSDLHRKLGTPSIASACYWSNEASYAKQNGGKYEFIVEKNLSLPQDKRFWTDMFQNATGWGLNTYQQDCMARQLRGVDVLYKNLTIGRDWLLEMGSAAEKLGISIQYGNAYPRQALQALHIKSVTQISITDVLSPQSWRIGITSLLAKALGLAPSAGPFVTYPHSENTSFDNPKVGSLISTLSTGPVGFGDEIGRTNKTILMKCCNDDGIILNPDHPAVALNKQLIKAAFPATDGPEGEVWVSYSDISGLRFANLLVMDVKEGTQFSLTQEDIGLFDHAGDDNLYAIPYDNALGWGLLTTFGQLTFTDACSMENICLYHLATAIPNWFMTVIFGEMDKWVPMSPKRVVSISWTNTTVTAPLRGAANETFDFWYILGSKVDMVACTLSINGLAIFKMDNNLGIVTCG